jgi:hypothetical protein
MSTSETKLTVENCSGAFSSDPSLGFSHANREVLRITHDGHIICGEGLSVNAATQEAAKLLIASFEEQIQKMVDARLAVDTARLDWLSTQQRVAYDNGTWLRCQLGQHPTRTLRAAIDAAMKKASK